MVPAGIDAGEFRGPGTRRPGRQRAADLLQLACYGIGYAMANPGLEPEQLPIGVLHCPREVGTSPAWPELTLRPCGEELVAQTETQLRRIVELVAEPGRATASPGPQCRRCRVMTCPVRAS